MSAKQRKILPPIWLLLFVGLVFLTHRGLPIMVLPDWLSHISRGFTAIGILIIAWPILAFLRASTGVVPFSPATSLVTGGLYRFTRNPMYLGMSLILLGGALHAGSLGALLPVPLFPIVIQQRFILAEEQFLESTFGAEYLTYCTQVRRWL